MNIEQIFNPSIWLGMWADDVGICEKCSDVAKHRCIGLFCCLLPTFSFPLPSALPLPFPPSLILLFLRELAKHWPIVTLPISHNLTLSVCMMLPRPKSIMGNPRFPWVSWVLFSHSLLHWSLYFHLLFSLTLLLLSPASSLSVSSSPEATSYRQLSASWWLSELRWEMSPGLELRYRIAIDWTFVSPQNSCVKT